MVSLYGIIEPIITSSTGLAQMVRSLTSGMVKIAPRG